MTNHELLKSIRDSINAAFADAKVADGEYEDWVVEKFINE
jgi:hypothetical protein